MPKVAPIPDAIPGRLGRARRVSGSLAEIQTEVQALNRDRRIPGRVQELIAVALKRLRDLNTP